MKELFAALQAEIERLRRSGKRQATPFSRGKRAQDPKKAGRKPGSGPFTYRRPPAAETVKNRVDLHVTAARCRVCGEVLETERVGATAHRLGRRALALAHVLPCGMGIPARKVPAVFHHFTGRSWMDSGGITSAATSSGSSPIPASSRPLP